ncbi:Kinase-like protein [Mycena indigotica]|uniref:Kinase-like protein n=1 Tax=Mycena indigotica TaxID=2126181 RepID=A0A8H6S5S5_9AGAR|nr:Kinase-like protein [Mycena indigotica]KAF7292740.1 Kinase-like protein [Mycena indigotica]
MALCDLPVLNAQPNVPMVPSQRPIESGRLVNIYLAARCKFGRWALGGRETVTRISRGRAVKRPAQMLLTEALNLDYVAQHTTIPVPRVHRMIKDKHGKLCMVMDYIEGQELEQIWGQLSEEERLNIVHELRGYIDQLRALVPPHPGSVEAVDGGPCKDFRIYRPVFGPFASVAEFCTFVGRDFMVERKLDEYPQYADAVLRCVGRTESYRTVFTHCDLAPRNIIIKDKKIAAIVDWEMAGWYPEYWEYTQAEASNSYCRPWGFWEVFEKEGFSRRYPDELMTELCIASEFTRC